MTPYEQLQYLNDDGDGEKTITFRTEKEYFEWLQNRKK